MSNQEGTMDGNLEVGQTVVVFAGSDKTNRRHDGTVTKVGRKLATVEWLEYGRTISRQFRLEDQRENVPPSRTYTYTPSFRTLEQDARAQRKHAAEDGFVRLGLRKNRADSLTLDEMEAVIRLLDQIRSAK